LAAKRPREAFVAQQCLIHALCLIFSSSMIITLYKISAFFQHIVPTKSFLRFNCDITNSMQLLTMNKNDMKSNVVLPANSRREHQFDSGDDAVISDIGDV